MKPYIHTYPISIIHYNLINMNIHADTDPPKIQIVIQPHQPQIHQIQYLNIYIIYIRNTCNNQTTPSTTITIKFIMSLYTLKIDYSSWTSHNLTYGSFCHPLLLVLDILDLLKLLGLYYHFGLGYL